MAVAVLATWYVRGSLTQAMAALKALAVKVEASEDGTMMYLVHSVGPAAVPPPAPKAIVFYEVYRDARALQRHLDGPVFTAFKRRYKRLFVPDASGNPLVLFQPLTRFAGFIRR